MAVQTRGLTYEEYLKLPEIKKRYDIIDGELIYMTPSPTPKHQRIALQISLRLAPFVEKNDLGELLIAPLDIRITLDPLRTRQPDLLFIRKDRANIIGEQLIEGGPDLVIEILSPSNTRTVIESKLRDYLQVDVKECWLVSPEASTIEVLISSASGWQRAGLYGAGDVVSSAILPGLTLKVDELWPRP